MVWASPFVNKHFGEKHRKLTTIKKTENLRLREEGLSGIREKELPHSIR